MPKLKSLMHSMGYTLIETIMVVAIIGSILLYLIAFQNQQVITIQVETEAAQIQQVLQYAYAEHTETSIWPTEFPELTMNPAWGGSYRFTNTEDTFSLEYEIPQNVFPDETERRNIMSRIANLVPGAKVEIIEPEPPEEEAEEPPAEGEEAPPEEEENEEQAQSRYLLIAQVIKSPSTVPGGYQVKGMEKFDVTYDQLPASYPKAEKTFQCDSVKNWKPFCVQAMNFYDRDYDRLTTENHGNVTMAPVNPNLYRQTHKVPTVRKFGLSDPVMDEEGTNIAVDPELNAYQDRALQIEDIGGAGSNEYRCQLNPTIDLTGDQEAASWSWSGDLSYAEPPESTPTNDYPAGEYENKAWDINATVNEGNAGMKAQYLVIYGCCRGDACEFMQTE